MLREPRRRAVHFWEPVGEPRSSTLASSLGLSVVQCLIWLGAWKRQRWILAPGNTARAAFAKPGEPSQTHLAEGGDARRDRRPRLGRLPLARCHATGRPPATGAIGQIPHIQEVLRPNIDPFALSSAAESFEKSQRRKDASALALLSTLRDIDALHFRQRQRFVPAFVLSFPFILEPQMRQLGLFNAGSRL